MAAGGVTDAQEIDPGGEAEPGFAAVEAADIPGGKDAAAAQVEDFQTETGLGGVFHTEGAPAGIGVNPVIGGGLQILIQRQVSALTSDQDVVQLEGEGVPGEAMPGQADALLAPG